MFVLGQHFTDSSWMTCGALPGSPRAACSGPWQAGSCFVTQSTCTMTKSQTFLSASEIPATPQCTHYRWGNANDLLCVCNEMKRLTGEDLWGGWYWESTHQSPRPPKGKQILITELFPAPVQASWSTVQFI